MREFLMTLLIVMALMQFVLLIRAIKGPRVADRIVAVNMMGTIVMVMIATLSLVLGENYLVDICLIYACVSFLAVVVISKVYIGIYEEKKHEQASPAVEEAVDTAEDAAEKKGERE